MSGSWAAPNGETTDYLVTPGSGGSGQVGISFSGNQSYLGLFWGSIDTYNYIDFYKNNAIVGTISGGQLPPDVEANGGWVGDASNRYVNIYANDFSFDAIVLRSTGVAFEVDNIATAPVPEPTTMLLFGAGIAGLAGIARRRKAN